MAPWLRVCLTVQGTWVPSLVRELRFPMLWNNYAHVSQVLRPCTPAGESALQQRSCVLQLGPDIAKLANIKIPAGLFYRTLYAPTSKG